jgi:hypothetical protein
MTYNTQNSTQSNSSSNTGMKNSSSNNFLTKYMDLKAASKKRNRKSHRKPSPLRRTSSNIKKDRQGPPTGHRRAKSDTERINRFPTPNNINNHNNRNNRNNRNRQGIKNTNNHCYKQRKSANTMLREKEIKKTFFTRWMDTSKTSNKDTTNMTQYDPKPYITRGRRFCSSNTCCNLSHGNNMSCCDSPTPSPHSYVQSSPELKYGQVSILDRISQLNLDNDSEEEAKTKVEVIKKLLNRLKNDNKRIEQLLKSGLDIKLQEKQDYELEEEDLPSTYICIREPMNTVTDLIKIGQMYEKYKNYTDVYFNIDLKVLYNIVEPLKELEEMVGLTEIKTNIVKKIVFYIQHLENRNNEYLNTLIYGNPGTGKSRIGHIIAKIYGALGFLPKGHVVSVKADDCIGAAVGQTSIKTRSVLQKALGGFLIIDEAYSLGSYENKSYIDDFIGTFLSFSSEHKGEFGCILMGYKDCIEKNILDVNKGMRRRFPNIMNINDYKIKELRDILVSKIKEYNWYYEEDALPLCLLQQNKKYFKENGGSMENLFSEIKFAHATRVLYLPPEKKKTLSIEDFEKGLDAYKQIVKLHQSNELSENNLMYM